MICTHARAGGVAAGVPGTTTGASGRGPSTVHVPRAHSCACAARNASSAIGGRSPDMGVGDGARIASVAPASTVRGAGDAVCTAGDGAGAAARGAGTEARPAAHAATRVSGSAVRAMGARQ
jgi:hypothetical protein